ncbi:MAG: hypothetical protein M1821_007586 [Bathelium mastoideum]|nr:MAG: hypothetical protein M1821_007586 [Bathelium mastoideum]
MPILKEAAKSVEEEFRKNWKELAEIGKRCSLSDAFANPRKGSFTANEMSVTWGKGAPSFRAMVSSRLGVGTHTVNNQGIRTLIDHIGDEGLWRCQFMRQKTEHGKSPWVGICQCGTKGSVSGINPTDPTKLQLLSEFNRDKLD